MATSRSTWRPNIGSTNHAWLLDHLERAGLALQPGVVRKPWNLSQNQFLHRQPAIFPMTLAGWIKLGNCSFRLHNFANGALNNYTPRKFEETSRWQPKFLLHKWIKTHGAKCFLWKWKWFYSDLDLMSPKSIFCLWSWLGHWDFLVQSSLSLAIWVSPLASMDRFGIQQWLWSRWKENDGCFAHICCSRTVCVEYIVDYNKAETRQAKDRCVTEH